MYPFKIGRTALFANKKDTRMDFQAQFLYACKNGHLERAERLLKDGNFDPSQDNNAVLVWAVENGLAAVVKVLLRDERIDINCQDGICLQIASELGDIDVLSALLQDKRANPGAQNSLALWLAAENGHTGIVRQLIEDGRSDVTAKNEDMLPLEAALLHDHFEAGAILLAATKHATKTSSQASQEEVISVGMPKEELKETIRQSTEHIKRRSTMRKKGSLLNPTSARRASFISENSKKMKVSKNKGSLYYIRSARPLSSIPHRKLADIMAGIKRISLEEFREEIRHLKEGHYPSPGSLFFNEALRKLVSGSIANEMVSKHRFRASCYEATEILLDYGKTFSDLSLEPETLKAFDSYYSPFKTSVRKFFSLRDLQDPRHLLSNTLV
jgi:Ankyrin repeats (3 copies)